MVLSYATTAACVVATIVACALARLLLQVLQLGIGGAAFLAQNHARFGDTFSIGALPPRLVFLFDPAAVRQFFTAPVDEVDFRAAVEHFTQRVFQLSNEDFFPRHQRLWRGLRNLLTGSTVPAHAAALTAELQLALHDSWQHGKQVDLLEAVKATVFPVVARLLYGQAFVTAHGSAALRGAFYTFEETFELAASPVPHMLQRRFCRARSFLLTAFRQSMAAGHFAGTIVGELLAECDVSASEAPHILLAVLWASMANSVPATFWTLALLSLPSSRPLVADIRREAAGVGKATSPEQQAVQMALDARSSMRLAVDEAIRLFSPSINIRVAAKDLVLPAEAGRVTKVRRGTILAICPFLCHRDARIFPDAPGAFRPQRYAATSAAGPGKDMQAASQAAQPSGLRARLAAFASGKQRRAPAGESSVGTPQHGDSTADGGASAGGPAILGDPADSPGDAADELGAIPGVSQTGMGFGGGRFRCPGRAFAEMEIALFAATVLLRFDLQPAPHPPAQAAAGAEPWWQRLLFPTAALQARWKAEVAPDAPQYLPDIQHRRLVGIKWPSAPCHVKLHGLTELALR